MKKVLLAALLLLSAGLLFAQKATVFARLEFYDNPAEIQISDLKGFKEQSIYFGFELNPGHTIKTGKTSAEIKLYPNGSIIKLSPDTTISIKNLQGLPGAKSNDFGVVSGKLRVVAAKLGGQNYNFSTPSAVAGVRGTDFGLAVANGMEKLVVRDGLVDFSKGGNTLSVAKGMAADAFASTFAAVPLSLNDLADFFQGMDFQVLTPLDVPGNAAEKATDKPVADKPADKPADKNNGMSTTPVVDTNAGVDTATNDGTDTAAAPTKRETPEWQKVLMDVLGMEIGSITIDNVTYGKAVLQPKIKTDGFGIGFYLPIIYQSDLFDPNDWYKPAGNNEWSFGTDQNGEIWPIISDVFRDLVLKIKYLEIGEYDDDFFLKIGNIPSMTLGHGMLINEYANDADFPAIRRLGTNLGFDAGTSVFEVLVNDLSTPEVMGLRYVLQPMDPSYEMGIGISVATDLNPAANAPANSPFDDVETGRPMIFHLGMDLDIPIVKTDIFAIKAYADFATVVPYLRNATSGLAEGFHFESALEPVDLKLRNYGWKIGVSGKVLIIDWVVEFLYSQGAFEMGYYNQPYDRIRAAKAERIVDSLQNIRTNTLYDTAKMGIYGSAKADIFQIVNLVAAYRWPWNTTEDLAAAMSNPDTFILEVDTVADKLPYGIQLNVSYTRNHLNRLIMGESGYDLFDQYTTLAGGLTVPLSDFFALRVAVGTAIKRNSDGTVFYDASGNTAMYPVLNIETKIGQ